MTEQEQLSVLTDYAEGRIGTRAAIDALGWRDYADLLIALVRHDLPLPKPTETPALAAHRARATEILQPRLRRGG